jgi:hypothetical protein
MSSKEAHVQDPAVPGSDFGAFYPTGSVVIAFPDADAAQTVHSSLLNGGHDAADCRFFSADEMKAAMTKNLAHLGFLASLGRSEEMMARYRELATDGCAFVIVHAPVPAESDRVMRVVRRGPFVLAQKYHKLAIEDLK